MSKSEYKKIIDNFLIENFEFLNECAENILRTNRHLSNDLVAEMIIYLYGHQKKLEMYIDIKMLQAFCVSWMKLQCQYKTTPFWRKFGTTDDEEYLGVDLEADDLEADINEDEYITDLRHIYTDEQIKKILNIHEIYPTLSEVHKILFDAYFIENLSYDKIKDKYTFFRTKNGKKVYYKSKKSIYNLMKELKDEIKSKLK
jgi:hypothetical protein